jgi:hypothetical protein
LDAWERRDNAITEFSTKHDGEWKELAARIRDLPAPTTVNAALGMLRDLQPRITDFSRCISEGQQDLQHQITNAFLLNAFWDINTKDTAWAVVAAAAGAFLNNQQKFLEVLLTHPTDANANFYFAAVTDVSPVSGLDETVAYWLASAWRFLKWSDDERGFQNIKVVSSHLGNGSNGQLANAVYDAAKDRLGGRNARAHAVLDRWTRTDDFRMTPTPSDGLTSPPADVPTPPPADVPTPPPADVPTSPPADVQFIPGLPPLVQWLLQTGHDMHWLEHWCATLPLPERLALPPPAVDGVILLCNPFATGRAVAETAGYVVLPPMSGCPHSRLVDAATWNKEGTTE